MDFMKIQKNPNGLYGLWADKRSYLKRCLLAAAPVSALCYMILFFGPLEIVAFGKDSFLYHYTDTAGAMALVMAGAILLMTAGLALLRGKIFNYALSAVFAFLLGSYIQSMFMNGNLGQLTGDAVEWFQHPGTMAWQLAVWGGILAAVLLLMYLSRKYWKKTVVLVSSALLIIQMVPAVLIFTGVYADTRLTGMNEFGLYDGEMYSLSKNKNVFVIILDRLDYDYIESVKKQDPEFFAPLEGFVSYTNAMSAYARTRPALNHILTGTDLIPYDMEPSQFYRESWETAEPNLLEALDSAGYIEECYTEAGDLFEDPEFAERYIRNLQKKSGKINYQKLIPRLMRLSFYRYCPMALKPFFWQDGAYYNQVFDAQLSSVYQMNDAYYTRLFQRASADREENCFKFYHFMGSHAPYNVDAQGNHSDTPTTVEAQTIGVFRNLNGAFARMKELGIYEDAAIIITGDHGASVSDLKPLQKPTRIGLLYKPSGSAGKPLSYSAAPVTVANIPATVLKNAGLSYGQFPPALDEVPEDQPLTRFYYKALLDSETYAENGYMTYEVTGDASKMENWKEIGFTSGHSYN